MRRNDAKINTEASSCVVSCCCQVTLSGVDPSRVVVGNVMCKAGGVLPAVRRFNAQIVALPALEVRRGARDQRPFCERAHFCVGDGCDTLAASSFLSWVLVVGALHVSASLA